MYKTYLFSDSSQVNGESITVSFLPDFRQDVAIDFKDRNYHVRYESDGRIIKKENLDQIHISLSGASWFLIETSFGKENLYELYITNKTREIRTSLGEEFNRNIKELVKTARIKYNEKLNTQLFLYYYDSKKERLNLVEKKSDFYEQKYEYDLSRPYHHCSIERRFETPKQDCFIIGRICKTIGARKGDLHDFIEPVYTVYFDFERQVNDLLSIEYNDKVNEFKNIMLTLFCFTIVKEHDSESIEIRRVAEYVKKARGRYESKEEAIKVFISEIYEAFKNKDSEKIRNLYMVLHTMMDCSTCMFNIKAVYRITGGVHIQYENGEDDIVDTTWIEANKRRCINYDAISG